QTQAMSELRRRQPRTIGHQAEQARLSYCCCCIEIYLACAETIFDTNHKEQKVTPIDNKKQTLLVLKNVLIFCLAYNFKCVPGKKGCPEKWIRFGSSCYFFSGESKTWDEARESCRAIEADLVVINTKEENEFISKLNKQKFWIGLSDRDLEGTWKWVDGSSLDLFWASGQPDNHKGGEDCGHMLAYFESPGLWNDVQCSFAMQWICEKEEMLFV
uniref:C-type lectin domain-containing protein n=1 Tax=Oryzias latipes TaxID=8090 RepID=A0A3B3HYY4_ORYLA